MTATDDTAPDAGARRRGNLFGLTAVLLWGSWAPLMVAGGAMPPFLFLAIAFSGGAGVMLLRRAILRRGFADLFATPWPTLALGFAGLWGSNALFALSLRAGAAPVAATIVTHTWPVWMVVVVLALRIARGTLWDMLALMLGFAGVVAVAVRDGSFELHIGLVMALVASWLWATYSGARTKVPAGPPDALTVFATTAAVASWLCHFALGESFDAAPVDIAVALAVGILPMGIANAFWDVAVRRGDPVLLAGISFIEPVIATGLILLMLAQLPRLLDMVGLVLVLGGVALGTLGERRRRAGAAPIKPPIGPAPRSLEEEGLPPG
jgi:drug/metabolite transporter (DMT)-like permease